MYSIWLEYDYFCLIYKNLVFLLMVVFCFFIWFYAPTCPFYSINLVVYIGIKGLLSMRILLHIYVQIAVNLLMCKYIVCITRGTNPLFKSSYILEEKLAKLWISKEICLVFEIVWKLFKSWWKTKMIANHNYCFSTLLKKLCIVEYLRAHFHQPIQFKAYEHTFSWSVIII